jgi:eukaryotic-like serine/threonine-protein kinase
MSVEAGTKLGPYEILSALGAGGMGEVYRARDARLSRDVALKVLPSGVADDPSRRARFEKEARSASALNHPNIITVFDIGAQDGAAYIVSELVEGEPLRALIQRGPVAVRKLLDIAVQLADGLAAAHAAGIIHRDLKPENVMLTREGRVKILDFGLAKQTGAVTPADGRTASLQQTHPGTILGTVSYMSPEQARGVALDFHSDQFSLGLVLYEAASGKKAFQKPESVQTLSAIITEDPPPLEVKLPAPLRWAIDRCLAKEPRDRYDSTRDLYQELRSLRDHLSESFPTDSGVAAPVSKLRHNRLRLALAGLAGALIVILAVFLVAGLFSKQQGPDLAQERFTPLGTGLSQAGSPAWSPDGKSFAYTGLVNGEDQVFVRTLGSPVAIQITRTPAGSVAFWSTDSSRVFYYGPGDKGASLWSVAVAGGEPELVMKDLITATLSPDGRDLAVLRSEGGSVSVWISSPPGSQLRKYSPAPFEKTGIFNFPSMSFSPDGSKILLSILGTAAGKNGSEHEWWLIPYPQGPGRVPRRALQALPPPHDAPWFSWMPDSRHVVLSMSIDRRSARRLWMADTQSDAYSLLTSGLDNEDGPAVSPDGQRVVFVDRRLDYDLEEVSLNGGVPRALITTDRSQFNPAWSPVAQQFAYVTDRNGPEEIWLKSVQEGWSRPLVTPDQFSDPTYGFWGPVFSPDGSRIAYVRYNRNVVSIWISSASGGAPVRLTHEAATTDEFPPAWSPDGNWLAYNRFEGGIAALVKFRLGSSEPPVVLRQKTQGFVPAWSPTGDWITSRENGDWLLVSPDGKSERNLGPLKTGYLLWSRDGKTLYGIGPNKDHHQVLVSLDVASGHQKEVQDLGTEFLPGEPWDPAMRFSMAPDGEGFAVSIRKERSDLWMLEGFNSRGWFGK